MAKEEKEDGWSTGTFVAVFTAFGAMLPLAFLCLLFAAGFIKAGGPGGGARAGALTLGMFFGGFGICAARFTGPVLLNKLLFIPVRAAVPVSKYLFSVWLAGPSLLALSVYSFISLGPGPALEAGDWLPVGALALAAGVGLRAWLEAREFLRSRALGEVGFAQDELACAPGGGAAAVLRTGKKAASVRAKLVFYPDEEEKKLSVYPAEVSAPAPAAGGWEYRIKITLPADGRKDGSWCLSAVAESGRVQKEVSIDVVPGNAG